MNVYFTGQNIEFEVTLSFWSLLSWISLQRLSLSYPNSVFERNCRLSELYLGNNPFSEEAAFAIGTSLQKNSNLAVLDLENVLIGRAGGRQFAETIRSNQRLRKLVIDASTLSRVEVFYGLFFSFRGRSPRKIRSWILFGLSSLNSFWTLVNFHSFLFLWWQLDGVCDALGENSVLEELVFTGDLREFDAPELSSIRRLHFRLKGMNTSQPLSVPVRRRRISTPLSLTLLCLRLWHSNIFTSIYISSLLFLTIFFFFFFGGG